MYRELTEYETFDEALESVYGRTLEQLSDEFQLRHAPAVLPVRRDATRRLSLLGRRGHPARHQARVRRAVHGRRPARRGAVSLARSSGYLTSAHGAGGRPGRGTVVRGGPLGQLESFHPFDSRMDASARRPAALLRALSGPRRADHLGPGAATAARALPVPRAGVDPLSPVAARRARASSSAACRRAASPISIGSGCRAESSSSSPPTRYQDLDPGAEPGRRPASSSPPTAGRADRTGAVNLFMLELGSGRSAS